MARSSGHVQGRKAVFILGVDVHPSRNKQPYRRYIPRSDALQKGCRCIGDPLLIERTTSCLRSQEFRIRHGLANPRWQRGIQRIDAIRPYQIGIGKVDVAIGIHIAERNVGDMSRKSRGIDAVHGHEQSIDNIDATIAVDIP